MTSQTQHNKNATDKVFTITLIHPYLLRVANSTVLQVEKDSNGHSAMNHLQCYNTVGRFLIASIYQLQIASISCICGFANINMRVYYNIWYGSTIAIIGFTIWPDFPRTQSLNHAIKTLPTVLYKPLLF